MLLEILYEYIRRAYLSDYFIKSLNLLHAVDHEDLQVLQLKVKKISDNPIEYLHG